MTKQERTEINQRLISDAIDAQKNNWAELDMRQDYHATLPAKLSDSKEWRITAIKRVIRNNASRILRLAYEWDIYLTCPTIDKLTKDTKLSTGDPNND